MGFFALRMLRIALELSKKDPVYEMLATIFYEHFVYIASAITKNKKCGIEMWDEKDGFFYDILSFPNGKTELLKIRSLVGLVPFFSIDYFDDSEIKQFKKFYNNFHIFNNHHKTLISGCVFEIDRGADTRYLFALNPVKDIERVLQRIYDPEEFRSPFGLRSLSKYHAKHPFRYDNTYVGYEPGESLERIKGGNSNWRGPVWVAPTFLLIDSLKRIHAAVGSEIQIQISGEKKITCDGIALYFANALIANCFPSLRR